MIHYKSDKELLALKGVLLYFKTEISQEIVASVEISFSFSPLPLLHSFLSFFTMAINFPVKLGYFTVVNVSSNS